MWKREKQEARRWRVEERFGRVVKQLIAASQAGLATNSRPNPSRITRRISSEAVAENKTHTQIMSFEDSAIRIAQFSVFWQRTQ